MAIEINIKRVKKAKLLPCHADILKKYAKPGRNPVKALNAMYGLWEGRNITIDTIRAKQSIGDKL